MKNVRVAALQFAAGTDVLANKEKILAMIDKAAFEKPDLMVTPEFANHASWYQSAEHCYEVSLGLDDPFLHEVAARARQHRCYIVLNVTLRRASSQCTGSSLLFDRQGQILAISDKQVLMGHENDFLQRGLTPTPVVETDIGRIGLYACMDGVIAETPRDLALRGAQILCNSLNSFAIDEASLHVPVRAAENKVFVVAANKIGPLIPEDQLAMASAFTHIPIHFLYGAGESQIVAPDGTVLVKASTTNEEVVIADIQPAQADAKQRPDGNPIFTWRRPELYRPLHQEPAPCPQHPNARERRVACWQSQEKGEAAVRALLASLTELAERHDLLVLPELFFADSLDSLNLDQALHQSTEVLQALTGALRPLHLQIVGSFMRQVEGKAQHSSLLLSSAGILLEQPQLHHAQRYGTALRLGDKLAYLDTEYGRIGLITGEDAVYPELFRLHALQGVDLVCVSGHVQERWEIETGLVERAAENRLCLAFASRPQAAGASFLADLEEDFTLMTPWKRRIFDGRINMPRTRLAPRFATVLADTLHLDRARNKTISARTHLLDSRPWYLPLV